MIERHVFAAIDRIQTPALRDLARSTARLVLENWFYILFVVFLLRFPYLVADWTDSEVMPRRPTGESAFWQSEMARALVLTCLAMSYNLLFGFAGILSLGHALLFGAGGYVTFILLNNYDGGLQFNVIAGVLILALALAALTQFNTRSIVIFTLTALVLTLLLLPGEDTISFYQAAAVAVLLSIIVSVVSGVVTLRLRGIYFSMFTLALAEMFWVLAKSGTFRNYTGAEDGLGFRDVLPESLNPTPTFDGSRLDIYRVSVVFFVIVFLAIRRYLNSPVGRVMMAIRENEERAKTIGYNILYYKVLTMIFSGIIATLSGLLFAVWTTDKRVHPEVLSLKYTVDPLLDTLIGGVGTLTGPVIATLSLTLGETYLRNNTFTLGTILIAGIPVWALLSALIVLLVFLALRRRIRRLGTSFLSRTQSMGQPEKSASQARQQLALFTSGAFAVLLAVGLVVGYLIYNGSDLGDRVYEVSDLWDLFLGAAFIIVVMVLPHGIVGTWNRFWAERRIRRAAQSSQQQKHA